MRRALRWFAVAVLAGCTNADSLLSPDRELEPRLSGSNWGVDADNDQLDDGLELSLANQYAPLLYLPYPIAQGSQTNGDWTRPANVPWLLQNTRLRMHHNNCNDHQFLNFGQVNATNLLQQAHQRYVRKWYGGCEHENPVQYSNSSWHPDDHYFLQQEDATHKGIADQGQWITYFHAYRNSSAGINIQYWFLWAYNDWTGFLNHEGDWEHVNVRLDANHQPVGVYFSTHNDLNWYTTASVQWFGGTHPKVWIADGSHATYRSQSACNTTYYPNDEGECWTLDWHRWFTWIDGKGTNAGLQGGGLVNMGEKSNPMPGQQWLRYSGRWGEKGEIDGTSGPRGPAYNSNGWWTTGMYVPPPPPPPPPCEPVPPAIICEEIY
jgi:hypothetical protein